MKSTKEIEINTDADNLEANEARISKRYAVLPETHKKIKIKAIELGVDDDGRFTQEILGKAIDSLIIENMELQKYKQDFAERVVHQEKLFSQK
jgi:hypothetical protein